MIKGLDGIEVRNQTHFESYSTEPQCGFFFVCVQIKMISLMRIKA